MNIILYENEKIDTYLIKEFLGTKTNLSLTCTHSFENLKSLLESYSHDLTILTDFETDGIENIFEKIHEISKIPVIVLLPENTLKEQSIHLLNKGADDVFIAPYDHEELYAKIFSIIRRSKGFSSTEIQVGSLKISPANSNVTIENVVIPLTKKEYMVFESLVMRKGEISTKEMLLDRLYGGIDEPGVRIIDAFVWHLRKKLKNFGIKDDYIQTVWGQGYRINPQAFKV